MNKVRTYINIVKGFLKYDNDYTVVLIPHDGKEIKRKNLHTSYFRKVMYTFGILSVVLISCMGAMFYVIYQGSMEQKELAEYRQNKQANEAKLQELAAMSENLQKNMSMLSKLREQVGENMKASGMQVDANVTNGETKKEEKYAGKGGPNGYGVSGLSIVLEQNKNLQENMKSEIKDWEKLLTNIKSESYRISVTPNSWPVEGGFVSSEYGSRLNPFDESSGDFHPGIDIAAAYGEPVYASASGYVQQAGWYGGYGKYINISHDYGYETAYGHLSGIEVKSGEFVNKGDLIGYVGSTGYSTGPHLHFEIKCYGSLMDPRSLLK